MKKLLALTISLAAFCFGESLQSISVPAGSTSASWTNTSSRAYANRIIYTMSGATTTNETLTFTFTGTQTGSMASNESAVVVSFSKSIIVDSNTVVGINRTSATTNTTGNAVLVFD